jgi:[ribosomal protein S5]-alanine N-acetyltransferase
LRPVNGRQFHRRDVLLRYARESDVDAIYTNLRDPRVLRETMLPQPFTKANAIRYVNTALEHYRKSPIERLRYFIVVDGDSAGAVDLRLDRRIGELGYWLGVNYWGRGIMTWSLLTLVPYFIKKFRLVRLAAGVFSGNGASAAVLTKVGFAYEGTLRKSVIRFNVYKDIEIYSIIA